MMLMNFWGLFCETRYDVVIFSGHSDGETNRLIEDSMAWLKGKNFEAIWDVLKRAIPKDEKHIAVDAMHFG